MRRLLLALVLGLGFASQSLAQTADRTYATRRLDGHELSSIFEAWSAVERQLQPPAPLAEFYVHYSSSESGVINVWFFKPNTVTRAENGDTIIRHDLLSYRVVIQNGATRIIVN